MHKADLGTLIEAFFCKRLISSVEPVRIRLPRIGTHSDCFWPLPRNGSTVRLRNSHSRKSVPHW
jgi:hypothetical protein